MRRIRILLGMLGLIALSPVVAISGVAFIICKVISDFNNYVIDKLIKFTK